MGSCSNPNPLADNRGWPTVYQLIGQWVGLGENSQPTDSRPISVVNSPSVSCRTINIHIPGLDVTGTEQG